MKGIKMSALALMRTDEIETEHFMLRKGIKAGKVIVLKKLWDGLKVSDEDFEDAERSLFDNNSAC